MGLLKGRKVMNSGDINAAWKKAGRAANADNTLSFMVAGGEIEATKFKGERGSEYRLG